MNQTVKLTTSSGGKVGAAMLAGLLLLGIGQGARADSGFYVGGSVGSSTLQAEIPDDNLTDVFKFDENDFAWKLFGGFNFDLPVIQLAIEGGYVDLGGPTSTILSQDLGVDINGWDAFGVAGIDLGPIGLFGKVGAITWDLNATIDGIQAESDDGTDPAYGVGARFSLGSFQIRAEYEYFDLQDTEDLYMLSAGFLYTF